MSLLQNSPVSMKRRHLIIGGTLVFLITIAHAHRPTVTESPEARIARRYKAQVGHYPAHALSMEDAQGITKTLDAYKGQVVLLNFWASWCAPCLQEMPDLEKLAQGMQGRKFSLLAVSADDSWQEMHQKINYQNSAMKIYRDPAQTKKQHLLYGTEKFPETYVIDKEGQVRLRFINVQPWNDDAIRGYLEWLSDL
jgi:cytochrome c biogenesis protein CcmG, thiol:disulfide interchange protein DsbE